MAKPETGGKSWMTMGMVSASASAAKCALTLAEFSFGARGGLTITAEAPAACAARLNSRQVCRPSVVVPTTTGTRPLTCVSTVSSTSARSRSVRRAASPSTPSAVNPVTPGADEVLDIAPKALDIDVTTLPERRREY